MDFRIQDSYLKLHARHLAENEIQTALEEAQQEDEHILAKLSKHKATENF